VRAFSVRIQLALESNTGKPKVPSCGHDLAANVGAHLQVPDRIEPGKRDSLAGDLLPNPSISAKLLAVDRDELFNT
jgi:hypothetical protein